MQDPKTKRIELVFLPINKVLLLCDVLAFIDLAVCQSSRVWVIALAEFVDFSKRPHLLLCYEGVNFHPVSFFLAITRKMFNFKDLKKCISSYKLDHYIIYLLFPG